MMFASLISRSLSTGAFTKALRSHNAQITAKTMFFSARSLSATAYTARYAFETLSVSSPSEQVLHVELNRPEKLNAMNKQFWRELLDCFRDIQDDKHCRAVVVSGIGRMFSAGLDFSDMLDLTSQVTKNVDVARKAKFLKPLIKLYQESFNVIEKCSKPVIAAVHNGCVGGGINMICACDIRYCSEDAFFQIKEVDIGMAADLGVLQRMPKIVGNDSLVRELVYTAKRLSASEAKECGLVSKVLPDKEATVAAALELAQTIAKKSPVAVQGSKVNLVYSRDHTVQDGLEFMTNWNMTMLQSEDLFKAASATATKAEEQPVFSKL